MHRANLSVREMVVTTINYLKHTGQTSIVKTILVMLQTINKRVEICTLSVREMVVTTERKGRREQALYTMQSDHMTMLSA